MTWIVNSGKMDTGHVRMEVAPRFCNVHKLYVPDSSLRLNEIEIRIILK